MSWKSKTFDPPFGGLPALSIRGPELRQSLRVYTIATLYLTAHSSFVSGSHINSFCRMVGFTDWHMGLLTSLPPLAVFFQILATLPIERTGLRKHQFIDCSLWARLGWMAMAAVGLFMPLPSHVAVWIVLMIFVAMSCLDSFAGPAITTWMADILPRRIRARYIAMQGSLANLLRLFLLVGVSLLLDRMTDWGKKGPDGKISMLLSDQLLLFRTILGLFLVAGLLGLSMFLFHRIREVLPSVADAPPRRQKKAASPPQVPPEALPVRARSFLVRMVILGAKRLSRLAGRAAKLALRWARSDTRLGRLWARFLIKIVAAIRLLAFMIEVLVDPLRNSAFRQLAIYMTVLNFGSSVGGIYLWQNCAVNLGFSNLAQNVTFMFGGGLCAMLTLKPLGNMVDRFGRKPVMVVCAFATVLGILPWAFITKGTWDLGVTAGLNGLAAAAGGLVGHSDYVLISQGFPMGAFLAGLATASFAGIAWAGVGLAQTSWIYGFSDLGRSKYVAAFSVVTSVGVMVAGVAGGILTQSLQFLQRDPLHLGSLLWNNWHVVFVIGAAARLVAAIMMMRLPDESPRSAGDLLNYMAGWLPRLISRLFPFGGR